MKKWVLLLPLCALLACAAPKAETPAPTEAPAAETPAASLEAARVIDKLEVVSRPNKLDYNAGEMFDPTGLVVNAIYSDGTVEENIPWEDPRTVLTAKMASVMVECSGKMLRLSVNVIVAGNGDEYDVSALKPVSDSPLDGKTFFWLGSSVTFGAESKQQSIADFFGRKYGVNTIKEAVSGTSLATYRDKSYVERLDKAIENGAAPSVDAFICQLSTNDTKFTDQRGMILPDVVTDPAAFDTATAAGAIEYIIARAKETWDCPVYFYTNPPTGDAAYASLVELLGQAAEKWGVTVIDLYGDAAFLDITEDERALYMADSIHPTKAGYSVWWLPKFEEALLPQSQN